MSRIGKNPINIPSGVEVDVASSNVVTVKGPKGELSQKIDPDIKVSIEDGIITLTRPSDIGRHKAMHGLFRTLISNMVEGVSNGYTIKQELVGVGYKANANNGLLELSVGYSHDIVFQMPAEVKVTTVQEKGKNPTIILESADKELIGMVAAKIRALRKPEPYKGKGIRYAGEVVRRKAGKTAGK